MKTTIEAFTERGKTKVTGSAPNISRANHVPRLRGGASTWGGNALAGHEMALICRTYAMASHFHHPPPAIKILWLPMSDRDKQDLSDQFIALVVDGDTPASRELLKAFFASSWESLERSAAQLQPIADLKADWCIQYNGHPVKGWCVAVSTMEHEYRAAQERISGLYMMLNDLYRNHAPGDHS